MTRADFVILWDNFSNDKTLLYADNLVSYLNIGKHKKNGAQLFFTFNIENYIIKGKLIDERSKGFEPAGPFSVC